MIMAVKQGDGTIVDQFAKSSGSLSVIGGAGLAIGSFVSGGTATPNFTRFAKNGKQGTIATVVAFFIGNSLLNCHDHCHCSKNCNKRYGNITDHGKRLNSKICRCSHTCSCDQDQHPFYRSASAKKFTCYRNCKHCNTYAKPSDLCKTCQRTAKIYFRLRKNGENK